MSALIQIEQLRFAWPGAPRDCLVIDSLRIDAGSTVFLHGPSGSGKSTLLGLLAGVLVPAHGRVSLMGSDWSRLSGALRDAFRADHVGYIFQQFNLLPYLDLLDNVLLPCRFSALRHQRAAARSGSTADDARTLLRRVGLGEDLWHRKASALSVGQQQRVAAARALIGQPEVVIADEPTSALDAELRDDFMDLLLGECRQSHSTLVFVSHDQRLAERFDRRLSLPTINRAAAAAASGGDTPRAVDATIAAPDRDPPPPLREGMP